MATTTNFGWTTPDDSSAVKDGASAIRSLGTAVDTTMQTMVPKTIVDAKGDIIAASAADTVARLAVGANDTVLTADSSAATGLKWAAPASSSPASGSATVATLENTTSNTYTDLATPGPAVTLTTGTKALVLINSTLYKQASGSNAYVGFAVSGATTRAASDNTALNYVAAAYYDSRLSVSHLATGLTAGSNTFTLKYRQNGGGTAEYSRREIIVINLGS
jgi:hypothetical protein